MSRFISALRVGLRRSALIIALVSAPLAHAAVSGEGGVIAAFEGAAIVVVAKVGAVSQLAHSGFLAELEVERSLRSATSIEMTGRGAGDGPVVIAWEEPAPSLPSRLTEGRRVLVALVSLSTASIWRLRIPDGEKRASLLGLAGEGEGFLLRPAAGELDVIEHYLVLDGEARRGDAGILQLARLCAVGESRLATDAARRLKGLEALADHVTPAAAQAMLDALVRPDNDESTQLLLGVIREHRPPALRQVLEARIRAYQSNPPPILLSARAALDGGLDPETIEFLLASPDPAAREEAVRQLGGVGAGESLRELMRRDDAPRVRAAAVRRLARLEGIDAISDLISALEDPDPKVRFSAAQASASVGPEAGDRLREAALRGRSAGAQAAIAALSLMGPEAAGALLEIASEHSDAGMRTIAKIALGQPVGDEH